MQANERGEPEVDHKAGDFGNRILDVSFMRFLESHPYQINHTFLRIQNKATQSKAFLIIIYGITVLTHHQPL